MNIFRLGQRQLTLEELLEFNNLLTTVVRGQAPIEMTLELALEGGSRKFRRLLPAILHELREGRSLSQALNSQATYFPQPYREVVQAGEESGVLGTVLESYSQYLRQLKELRHHIGKAILYPIFVLLVAYILFVSVGAYSTEKFVAFYQDFEIVGLWILHSMQFIYRNVWIWFWIPPALIFLMMIGWLRSNDGQMLSLNGGAYPLRILPGLKRILYWHRLATLCELLNLLLERQVPFQEAWRISTTASGDLQLSQQRRQPGGGGEMPAAMPPFLSWMIETGSQGATVGRPLVQAGQIYRRRANLLTEWMKIIIPLIFLILIGGGATLFYSLTLFYPFSQILRQLSNFN